jgi:hypothetical protein
MFGFGCAENILGQQPDGQPVALQLMTFLNVIQRLWLS